MPRSAFSRSFASRGDPVSTACTGLPALNTSVMSLFTHAFSWRGPPLMFMPTFIACDPVTYDSDAVTVRTVDQCSEKYGAELMRRPVELSTTENVVGVTSGCGYRVYSCTYWLMPASSSIRLDTVDVHFVCHR